VASTTNFGWTTPDNTGYVKDGALAIRTLGSAIDTSMAELKGGTTGQVLKKTSGTDMDFEWGTVSSTPRIGQVLQAVITSNPYTTSTSYVDATSHTLSITPTLSTSKVKITSNFTLTTDGNFNVFPNGKAQLVRGSTSIYEAPSSGIYTGISTTVGSNYYHYTIVYLDSPATTSATTYKLQFKLGGAGNSVQILPQATFTLEEVLV